MKRFLCCCLRKGLVGLALKVALDRGHKTIVVLLLEKGADVNDQGRDYSDALQAALGGRHETIVVLLLEKGVEKGVP